MHRVRVRCSLHDPSPFQAHMIRRPVGIRYPFPVIDGCTDAVTPVPTARSQAMAGFSFSIASVPYSSHRMASLISCMGNLLLLGSAAVDIHAKVGARDTRHRGRSGRDYSSCWSFRN
jgi:hypothetical protein